MYSYFDLFFVKHQCSFRKGYNAQHWLLVMIEKMKEARDKNKVCAAVLTDRSKTFDCRNLRQFFLTPTCFSCQV